MDKRIETDIIAVKGRRAQTEKQTPDLKQTQKSRTPFNETFDAKCYY